jgi:predicted nucleic acid-binding protein
LNEFFLTPNGYWVLPVTTQEELEALEIMKKYRTDQPKKDFSLADAVQLVHAEKYGLTFYTTDTRLTYFDSQRAEVVNPYEI